LAWFRQTGAETRTRAYLTSAPACRMFAQGTARRELGVPHIDKEK